MSWCQRGLKVKKHKGFSQWLLASVVAELGSKGFHIAPCFGPLLDSGGVCSWAIILYMVYKWYVLWSGLGAIQRTHGIDCRLGVVGLQGSHEFLGQGYRAVALRRVPQYNLTKGFVWSYIPPRGLFKRSPGSLETQGYNPKGTTRST